MEYYAFGAFTHSAVIVGIQHYLDVNNTNLAPTTTQLQLQRQPTNPVDANAIQVCVVEHGDEGVKADDGGEVEDSVGLTVLQPIGHLQATLAAHLAPLLDHHILTINVTVDATRTQHSKYVVPITLAITPSANYEHNITLLDDTLKHCLYDTLALYRQPRTRLSNTSAHSNYYLRNFYTVTEYVLQQYAHLFDADEIAVVRVLQSQIPIEALTLYCRLVQRKAAIRWFALDPLSYTDCGVLGDTIKQLLAAATELGDNKTFTYLIRSSTDSTTDLSSLYRELFNYVTLTQLKLLIEKLGIKAKFDNKLSASELKESVLRYMHKQRLLSGQLIATDPSVKRKFDGVCGQWVQLNSRLVTLLLRIQRLFFVHIEHNDDYRAAPINPMLLHDLGVMRYYNALYGCNISNTSAYNLFTTRQTYIAYDTALSMLVRVQELVMNEEAEPVFHMLDLAYSRLVAEMQQPSCTADWHYCDYCSLREAQTPTLMRTCNCKVNDKPSPAKHTYDDSPFNVQTFTPHKTTDKPVPWQTRYRAVELYAGCLHYTTVMLEKHKRYTQCNELYKHLLSLPYYAHKRGYWWNRLALNLAEHADDYHTAYVVCQMGLSDTLVRTGDLLELKQRTIRLWRSKHGNNSNGDCPVVLDVGLTFAYKRRRSSGDKTELKRVDSSIVMGDGVNVAYIQGRPVNSDVGLKSRLYGYDGEPCNVEELSIQYYNREQNGRYNGIHCENTLLHTLYGLLMWHCIYTPVDDVFVNAYQDRPLDYHTDWFYVNRKQAIADRIQQLRDSDLAVELCTAWQYYGIRCAGVNWRAFTLKQITEMARCIGNQPLCNIFVALSESPYDWSGGLPDLFCWRVHGSTDQTIVKTDCIASDSKPLVSPNGSPLQSPTPQLSPEPIASPVPAQDDDDVCIISSTTSDKSVKQTANKPSRKSKRAVKQERASPLVQPAKPPLHAAVTPSLLPPQYANAYGSCKMIEVKGPRDRLSFQQRAWLNKLAQCGIVVELAHVTVDSSKLDQMDNEY